MREPELRLTFDDGVSDALTMVIHLEAEVASLLHVDPPPLFPGSFSRVAEVMRRKQYRKDLFIRACKQLGSLLAERMEDAEGWHDASRIEPAKKQLRG